MSFAGGFCATTLGGGLLKPPWNREKEETATSPISGDNGLLSARENPWSFGRSASDHQLERARYKPDLDPLNCDSLVPSFSPLSFSDIRLPPGVFGLTLVGEVVWS